MNDLSMDQPSVLAAATFLFLAWLASASITPLSSQLGDDLFLDVAQFVLSKKISLST
jgi:hypothetical protein